MDTSGIKNIEIILEREKDWKPSDIAFIREIELIIDEGLLMLKVLSQKKSASKTWPDSSKDFIEIGIRFHYVSNLTLKFAGDGFLQSTSFDITDMSKRGLENVNFQIIDHENGVLNFMCKEIYVVSADISRLKLSGE